jgi:hypothetical protein
MGKAILQAQYNAPAFIGGKADSSIRDIFWQDVPYKYAPAELKEVDYPKARGDAKQES